MQLRPLRAPPGEPAVSLGDCNVTRPDAAALDVDNECRQSPVTALGPGAVSSETVATRASAPRSSLCQSTAVLILVSQVFFGAIYGATGLLFWGFFFFGGGGLGGGGGGGGGPPWGEQGTFFQLLRQGKTPAEGCSFCWCFWGCVFFDSLLPMFTFMLVSFIFK